MLARGRVRQRDAVHDRHADIGQQQLEGAFLPEEHVERLRAVARGRHLVAVLLERARDQATDRFLVLGDQNAGHGQLLRSAIAASTLRSKATRCRRR
jgi:hypothetical protein